MSYVLFSPDDVQFFNACQPLHLTPISLEIEASSEKQYKSKENKSNAPPPACLSARPPSHRDQMMFPKWILPVSHDLFISDKFWPLNACQNSPAHRNRGRGLDDGRGSVCSPNFTPGFGRGSFTAS